MLRVEIVGSLRPVFFGGEERERDTSLIPF